MPHTSGKRTQTCLSRTAANLQLQVQYISTSSLRADPGNARTHSQRQIVRLKAVITELGFTNPILIDEDNMVIAGHARLEAAQSLGLKSVPCVRLKHLSLNQKTALALADNKLGDLSEFDPKKLAAQLAQLCAVDFNVEITGFETAEIDLILDSPAASEGTSSDPADMVQEPDRTLPPVSCLGDTWSLDKHRLHCGDALVEGSYNAVLGESLAAMIISDPPFNVKITGHVSGLGKTKHREFAMASGEMSPVEFTNFLSSAMLLMVRHSVNGSIHFIFMDWRHIREVTLAGDGAYRELKAVCVWNKTNGGMGSLYRSKYELVFVYKNGDAPHQNNVQLGKHGRYRTNVWDYAGANTFGRTRDADLAAHPTVKPVALIADAIRDCSKRGDIILDPFAGSGVLLLACERTGRRAAAIELDPHYVDTAVRRWQETTGKTATLTGTGETFDEIAARRAGFPSCVGRPTAEPEAGHD